MHLSNHSVPNVRLLYYVLYLNSTWCEFWIWVFVTNWQKTLNYGLKYLNFRACIFGMKIQIIDTVQKGDFFSQVVKNEFCSLVEKIVFFH